MMQKVGCYTQHLHDGGLERCRRKQDEDGVFERVETMRQAVGRLPLVV